MRIFRQVFLFYLGGFAYMLTEFLWRGRSHGSMFLLGGLCFLIIGLLWQSFPRLPLALHLLLCAALITILELFTGLAVNQDHSVWDYRVMPYNYLGQICLNYSLLWIPVSLLATLLYGRVEAFLRQRFPNIG